MQGRRTHVRVAFAMQADAPAARAAGAAPDGRPPLAIRARATKMPVLPALRMVLAARADALTCVLQVGGLRCKTRKDDVRLGH
jgi:hypothetical protein